ncbi:HlyD family secretion protein [Eubacteriales bacterium OttesenSCG-928-K08]|nr:HlyD family secretion protein [Eubacteriales bacterium OttesenSCG-928-K08]
MEEIKSAFDHQIVREKWDSPKGRVLRWSAWFLFLLIMCVLVAGAVDKRATVNAQAVEPKRATIEHVIPVEGKLTTDGDIPIAAIDGLLVQEVLVQTGSTVNKGDVLMKLDAKALEDVVADKRAQLNRKKAELDALEENAQKLEEQARLEVKRLQQDYALALEEADYEISKANAELKSALRLSNDYTRTLWGTADFSHELAQANEETIKAKEFAVDQAQLNRALLVLQYERSIYDAKRIEDTSESVELASFDYNQLKQELNTLEKQLTSGGELCAPCDGVITTVGASVGRLTDGEAALFINEAQSILFEGELNREQANYAVVGDQIQIKILDTNELITTTLAAVEPSQTDEKSYCFAAELPAGKGALGFEAEAMIIKSSIEYDCCIPLDALYQENGEYYVFCVREVKKALGKNEYFAQRVDVVLLESNESYAAVLAPELAQQQVIIKSSRLISDGDKLNLERGATQ